MATYVNNLRLKEIATGDESSTWGTSTNTNLDLITDGFSYGTKAMAADANETFTMPDATTDATRGFYLKITSAGTLTATRVVTLGPNTVSKVWLIENATTGSQIITIKQGSGATVNVASGSKVMLVTDGAGAGAAVINANPTEVGGSVTSVAVSGGTTGLTTSGGPVTGSGTITFAGTLVAANGGTGITALGTGVATAIAVNVGSAGAFTTFNGDLGTPSALVLTNATGTLTSPTFVTPALGTPASGTMTNVTGLPPAGVVGTAAILGANTFAGTQNFADNTLQRANLLDYGEVTNAIGSTGGGTQDIDLTLGNSVTATVDTSANTFTFSNPTASDEMCGFVLFLTNGGSQTVNWPASVDWPAATAPTLSASGVDILVFQTVDGGTIWHGQVASTLSS
jgi:hypothetical protein